MHGSGCMSHTSDQKMRDVLRGIIASRFRTSASRFVFGSGASFPYQFIVDNRVAELAFVAALEFGAISSSASRARDANEIYVFALELVVSDETVDCAAFTPAGNKANAPLVFLFERIFPQCVLTMLIAYKECSLFSAVSAKRWCVDTRNGPPSSQSRMRRYRLR